RGNEAHMRSLPSGLAQRGTSQCCGVAAKVQGHARERSVAMSKFMLSAGLLLSALVGFASFSHGCEPSQPAKAGAALAQPVSLAMATNYINKVVNITTSNGGSYVAVRVIDQDDRFL